MPLKEIDLIYRTMFAELDQRTLDGRFEVDYSVSGRFQKYTVKNRDYWYFIDPAATPSKRYVGPVEDSEITKRVEAFQEIKSDLKARRKFVTTLNREAGLPPPERLTGDVVAALGDAGLFRLRGVLIGTVAFQTYAAYLGVRFPGAVLQTADADFAQFHSSSVAVEDSIPPVLELLQELDPSFRPIPHQMDSRFSTQFANSSKYKVEFLTPNRGSDDLSGRPSPMPSLGGASAQPIRYLDFLIYEPVRTTMLHRSGVSVLVPSPERYAVHKLIVASQRLNDANGQAKRGKDLMQAKLLFEALALTRRQDVLAETFVEAWRRGPHWRQSITGGMNYLHEDDREPMLITLNSGLTAIGEEVEDFRWSGEMQASASRPK